MDAEKEKRFRFQMQYEQEQAQAQAQEQPQPSQPWYQTAANVGLGALETLYSPLQVAGEAIRGAGEGEPARLATAQDQRGFRAPSIVQRLIPSLRTDKPASDPFVKAYQGLEGLASLPTGIRNASQSVTQEPGIVSSLGGLAIGLGVGPAGDPFKAMNVARKTLFKPTIPAGRMAAVNAAREAGVPLSRAEQTGGRFITGLENTIEKTPLGSSTMEEARAISDEAMQAYRDRLLGKMGTTKENWDIGYGSKPAMENRASAMSKKRQEMFNAIPDNTHIPLDEYQKAGEEIVNYHKDVRPLARDPEVMAFAQDAMNPYGSSGEGVTGGPNIEGVTTQIPDTTKIVGKPDPLLGPKIVKVKGGPEYGVKYSFEPETEFAPKPNYRDLKAIRETLTVRITEAHQAGNSTREKYLYDLKNALDRDIENFVKNQDTPLGSMIGQEFASTYKKANAFSGAYKQLFKSDLATALEDAPPEKILGMVFQKNNETAIGKFHALVGDEAFQMAKKKWVSDLLESPNVTQALSEKKIDPGTLNAILSKPEQEALRKYGLVQGLRKTVNNLQGTSGSSRSNIAMGSYGAGIASLGSLLQGHWKIGLAESLGYLGPYPISKALTSKMATQGVNIRVPTSIPMPIRQAAMASFIDRVTTRQGQTGQ